MVPGKEATRFVSLGNKFGMSLRSRVPMYLTELRLINFRNYARLEAHFTPGLTVLYGDNAQGKTNFLEAIAYLATGRSPHTHSDRELIHLHAVNTGLSFAHVEGRVQRSDGLHHVRISVALNNNKQPSRVQKVVAFDGQRMPILEYIGEVAVVQFLPEDISLIASSPSKRRQYLDMTICQIDRQYCYDLTNYTQALRQRNAALRAVLEQGYDPEAAWAWDDPLVRHGSYLILRRQQVVAQLDEHVARVHAELTGRREKLHLHYLPCLELKHLAAYQLPLGGLPVTWGMAEVPLSFDEVETRFAEQLHKVRAEELRRGMTLIGPHRDDLRFVVDGDVDLTRFGSRGQQRTATLSLKLAEVVLIAAKKQDVPILLLDDILSELDETRRSYLSRLLRDQTQVFLTTTDPDQLAPQLRAEARLIRVEDGRFLEE